MAVGVANPKAQGQAMTKTATMRIMAEVKPTSVNTNHTPKVITAITITTGTNTPAT